MDNITFDKFKKDIVKIEFLEEHNSYGHHPFQLIAIDADGKMEMNALVGVGMQDIINRVQHYHKNKYKDIFLSMDLPKNTEIENDFVFALHIKSQEISSTMIEYSVETGEIINEIENSMSDTAKTIITYFM